MVLYLTRFRNCHLRQSGHISVRVWDGYVSFLGRPLLANTSSEKLLPGLFSLLLHFSEIQFYKLLVLSVDGCILLIWKNNIFNDPWC